MEKRTLTGHQISELQVAITDKIEELTGVKEEVITLKSSVQDIYSLNNSMFDTDVPQYTDGKEITVQDLADMNMRSLEAIADLLGIELEE